MLGLIGAAIPWPDHSQAPRNVYQSSMQKQALGIPMLNYKERTDTVFYVMSSLQKPLVYTKPSEYMGLNDMPAGVNAIVAVMSYTGFNQEDSIIMNLSSIQRGLFHVIGYRTVTVHEKKKGNSNVETICVPPENSGEDVNEGDPGYFRRKNGNFSLLEDVKGVVRNRQGVIIGYEKDEKGNLVDRTGVVRKGMKVYAGDILVGKILRRQNKSGEDSLIDCSYAAKAGEEGIVDEVYVETLGTGYKLVKIRIRKEKIPEPGDKFAARSAQKGTIGIVYRQEDMPFTSDGTVPDLIMNPHAYPSRMTINQLMECALGKYCAIEGEFGDCTPFTDASANQADKIAEKLSKTGFERHGWETMYNGFTGEMLEAQIFIGPTYYQRLKHMVSEKIHSRSKGHLTMMTRRKLVASVVLKSLLVHVMMGNISKLREQLVRLSILNYFRNGIAVIVNYYQYSKNSKDRVNPQPSL
jgi:DNA-directed RNA polymerase II subunit RPB2